MGRNRRRHASIASFSSSSLSATTPGQGNEQKQSSVENTNSTLTSLQASTIADVERTFALPSPFPDEGFMINEVEHMVDFNTEVVDDQPSSRLTQTAFNPGDLFTIDIVGPVISTLVCILFLLFTLYQANGVADNYETMDLSHKLVELQKISWFPTGGTFLEAQLTVGLVMAFSAFAQALTGFGFAVVAVGALSSMPWLLHSELYDVITPVAATLGALVGFILLIPYAFATGEKTEESPGLEWKEILPLLIPCTVLTPLGIQLNSMVDPAVGTRVLAGLILGFVGYKLLPMIQDFASGDQEDEGKQHDEMVASLSSATAVSSPLTATALASELEVVAGVNELENDDSQAIASALVAELEPTPWLQSRASAILFGSLAGISGGAFDVQGPPLCVYGDAKGWSPAQFRNNILTVVALNSALVVGIDYYQGLLGDFYYSYFCITSLPGVLVGVIIGQYASSRIDPVLFKNLVLIMCLGLGLQLLTVG